MRWLPLFLMLCGFGISQSSQLASIIEAMLETGVLFPGMRSFSSGSTKERAQPENKNTSEATALDYASRA